MHAADDDTSTLLPASAGIERNAADKAESAARAAATRVTAWLQRSPTGPLARASCADRAPAPATKAAATEADPSEADAADAADNASGDALADPAADTSAEDDAAEDDAAEAEAAAPAPARAPAAHRAD